MVAKLLPFDPVFEQIIFDLESDWVKGYVALNAQRMRYVVCVITGSTMKKLARYLLSCGGKELVQLFRRWQIGLLGGWYVMVTCVAGTDRERDVTMSVMAALHICICQTLRLGYMEGSLEVGGLVNRWA